MTHPPPAYYPEHYAYPLTMGSSDATDVSVPIYHPPGAAPAYCPQNDPAYNSAIMMPPPPRPVSAPRPMNAPGPQLKIHDAQKMKTCQPPLAHPLPGSNSSMSIGAPTKLSAAQLRRERKRVSCWNKLVRIFLILVALICALSAASSIGLLVADVGAAGIAGGFLAAMAIVLVVSAATFIYESLILCGRMQAAAVSPVASLVFLALWAGVTIAYGVLMRDVLEHIGSSTYSSSSSNSTGYKTYEWVCTKQNPWSLPRCRYQWVWHENTGLVSYRWTFNVQGRFEYCALAAVCAAAVCVLLELVLSGMALYERRKSRH